jgi:hypothetical protein
MVRQVGPTRTTRCGESDAETSRHSLGSRSDASSVCREGHLLDLVQPPQSTLNLPPRRLHHRELGYGQRRWVPDAAFQVGDLCSKGGVLIS